MPPFFAVVVQWDEPEPGVAVYGPYSSEDDAHAAFGETIWLDFVASEYDDLPADVRYEVQLMTLGSSDPWSE